VSSHLKQKQHNIQKHQFIRILHDCVRCNEISTHETFQSLGYFEHPGEWRITVDDNHGVTCRLLIDATGRNASIAKRMNVKKVYFDDHFALGTISQKYKQSKQLFILESGANGWWYSSSADGLTQSVFITSGIAGKTSAEIKACFERNFSATYHIKQNHGRLAGHVSVKDARAAVLQTCYGKGWLAIGDSAFTFDPLAGMGNETIMRCIFSNFELILEYLSSAELKCLEKIDLNLQKTFFDHIQLRSAYYKAERRWLKNDFWNSVN
jgi:flavin-dependent dehydrogenase